MTESEVAAYQEHVRQYQEQQQAEGAVAPQEPQETPQAEVAKPYNPFAAAIAQLDPKIQKASRAAIRQTIELLKQADESKWESIVTAMATKTPEILEYVGASSLAYVMHEGGASAEMITKVITEIKEKGLAPDTLRLS
jgi:arginyl-tRNA synthetase